MSELSDEQLDLYGSKLLQKIKFSGQLETMFDRFLDNLVRRVEKNNDNIIAVCGPRNSGKSCTSMVAALILRNKGMGFSMDNIFYGVEPIEEIIEKITNSRRQIFMFDEGIKVGNKKRAMSAVVTLFEETMTQVRKKNHIYLINIPKVRMLTGSTRNDLLHYWLEVYDKSQSDVVAEGWAKVMLFARDDNPVIDDNWGLDMAEKTMKYYKKKIRTPREKHDFLCKLRSYVNDMQVPRLPKIVEDHYESRAQEALSKFGRDLMSSKNPPKPPIQIAAPIPRRVDDIHADLF